MNIIVAGGRDFNDYELLCEEMKTHPYADITIIQGGQVTTNYKTGEKYGADYLGGKWAHENNIPCKVFTADWEMHGNAAGPIRNQEMAREADILIAFWDGKSRGTKNMIDNANQLGLEVHIVRY